MKQKTNSRIKIHIFLGAFMLFVCIFIGTKDIKAADTMAQLPKGKTFNLLLKQSVNSSVSDYYTAVDSTYATKIIFTTEKPTIYTKTSDKLSSYGVDIYINGTEIYLYNSVGFKLHAYSQSMFEKFSGITEIKGLKFCDTSSVTMMYYMFSGCESLTSLDVSNWNTNNVSAMEQIFYNCKHLITLDLNNWNVSKITYMVICLLAVNLYKL